MTPTATAKRQSKDFGKTVKKGVNQYILDKYKKNIVQKDEYLEFSIRGEKARKLAEISQVIKWLSEQDGDQVFEMLGKEFNKAYGEGKAGVTAVKMYLKKFGIIKPRVGQTQKMENGTWIDYVQIWEGASNGAAN